MSISNPLKELFSTWDEWHSFCLGFFEVICPWKPCHDMPAAEREILDMEYHYYLGGRAAATITWLVIVMLITVFVIFCLTSQ